MSDRKIILFVISFLGFFALLQTQTVIVKFGNKRFVQPLALYLVVGRLNNTIHVQNRHPAYKCTKKKTNQAIYWIVIYPVDSLTRP